MFWVNQNKIFLPESMHKSLMIIFQFNTKFSAHTSRTRLLVHSKPKMSDDRQVGCMNAPVDWKLKLLKEMDVSKLKIFIANWFTLNLQHSTWLQSDDYLKLYSWWLANHQWQNKYIAISIRILRITNRNIVWLFFPFKIKLNQ